MVEILSYMPWGKLLLVGVVALIIIAPRHWGDVERWIEQVRRSWS